jgi:hypothetical protein
MSFGFSVVEDEKSYGENGQRLRLLKEVRLYEVSPVTFPAYPQTEVSVRDWPREAEETRVEGTQETEGETPDFQTAPEVRKAEMEIEEPSVQHGEDLESTQVEERQATPQRAPAVEGQTERVRRLRLAAA